MCEDEIAKYRLTFDNTPAMIYKSPVQIFVRIFRTVSRAPKKIEYVCRAIIRRTSIIACVRASAAVQLIASPARSPSFGRLPQPKRHLRPIKQRVKTPADGVYLQFPFSYARIRFFSATNTAQISSISRCQPPQHQLWKQQQQGQQQQLYTSFLGSCSSGRGQQQQQQQGQHLYGSFLGSCSNSCIDCGWV